MSRATLNDLPYRRQAYWSQVLDNSVIPTVSSHRDFPCVMVDRDTVLTDNAISDLPTLPLYLYLPQPSRRRLPCLKRQPSIYTLPLPCQLNCDRSNTLTQISRIVFETLPVHHPSAMEATKSAVTALGTRPYL